MRKNVLKSIKQRHQSQDATITLPLPAYFSILAVLLFCLLSHTACTRSTMQTDLIPENDQLLSRINTILEEYPEAAVAVSIRDKENDLQFDLNEDRVFHAASTMKIPVMIEVFRQASLRRISLQDSIAVENSFRSIVDNSLYSIEDDSDDAIYSMLGEKMSIRSLVYQMITVSSNLATNLLIDAVSADSVQATAIALGIKDMEVLRGVEDIKAFESGKSNTTTSADLALLLNALQSERAVSPSLDKEMVEILLDQQFNEMIPAGLPQDVVVAHKTGNITSIHHDAAIVYPPGSTPYVLVILIEGILDESRSATLGAALTATVHSLLRP